MTTEIHKIYDNIIKKAVVTELVTVGKFYKFFVYLMLIKLVFGNFVDGPEIGIGIIHGSLLRKNSF